MNKIGRRLEKLGKIASKSSTVAAKSSSVAFNLRSSNEIPGPKSYPFLGSIFSLKIFGKLIKYNIQLQKKTLLSFLNNIFLRR